MRTFVLSEWLLLKWESESNIPNYRQLYLLLRNAITAGDIVAGTKLPSTRALSLDMHISRNTVVQTYEQLVDEGYIHTVFGSGTYVQNINEEIVDYLPINNKKTIRTKPKPSLKLLSKRGSYLMENIGFSNQQSGAFVPGIPDIREFPIKKWLILQNRLWRKNYDKLLSYAPSGGFNPLRESISRYVNKARNVNSNSSQVILTTGIYQGIDITARLLCDPGDTVWVEEPSYSGLRNLLIGLGLKINPIPVDDEGLILSQAGSNEVPKLIVVSPSHQYPLGMVMSLSRRRALLNYAHRTSAWILEDDYDSEFRYEHRPLPSLQGMDEAGRVLYVSSFSKTLAPGLRVGFLIVPEALKQSFSDSVSELHREGNMMTHAILKDFIDEGFFESHIRRMRKLYSERRDYLIEIIKNRFGDSLQIIGSDAGLHLVVTLPKNVDDSNIVNVANKKGIGVRPLSMYYYDKSAYSSGLVLGYGGATIEEIELGFSCLEKILKKHI